MFHCTDELTTYLKILLFQHISTRLWRDVIQARLLITRPTNAVEIFESFPLFYAIQTNIARLVTELLIANLWLELLPLWFEANTCVYFLCIIFSFTTVSFLWEVATSECGSSQRYWNSYRDQFLLQSSSTVTSWTKYIYSCRTMGLIYW